MTEVLLPPITVPELGDEYNQAVAESQDYLSLARSSRVQKQLVKKLTTLKDRIKGYKIGAIRSNMEREANMLFHLQCALNAYICFLKLLLAVKTSDYHKAWVLLIDAQEYISVAHRAHHSAGHLDGLSDHLDKVEQVIFPYFNLYNSMGSVIRGGVCTVCSQAFGSCEHIEGRVYWGKLCLRVHYEVVKLDHSAFVKVPQDRRCIITEVYDDGWMLDNFTRDRKKKVGPPGEGYIGQMGGVMFHFPLLDVT